MAIFRSLEPAPWQNVSVPMVVRPFLVAASRIGRQVAPSGPLARGPAGVAETVVGSASMFSGTTVYEVVAVGGGVEGLPRGFQQPAPLQRAQAELG